MKTFFFFFSKVKIRGFLEKVLFFGLCGNVGLQTFTGGK